MHAASDLSNDRGGLARRRRLGRFAAAAAVVGVAFVGARIVASSRPPLLLWVDDAASFDVRETPGGARDDGTWTAGYGSVDYRVRPRSVVEDVKERLGIGSPSAQRLIRYLRTPHTEKDEHGRPWRAIVREFEPGDDAAPREDLVGRWEITFDESVAREVVSLDADGSVRGERWLGTWGAAGRVLALNASPVRLSYASPGVVAVLDETGHAFVGDARSVLGTFRGRRVRE